MKVGGIRVEVEIDGKQFVRELPPRPAPMSNEEGLKTVVNEAEELATRIVIAATLDNPITVSTNEG